MRLEPSTLIVAAIALFAAGAAQAAFRCVDKSGKTVYMERPCATLGLQTAKELKDPPKGDGTNRPLPAGTVISTPAEDPKNRDKARMVPYQCETERIRCFPGDRVICGGKQVTCDSD
jgi:hypothetical protein